MMDKDIHIYEIVAAVLSISILSMIVYKSLEYKFTRIPVSFIMSILIIWSYLSIGWLPQIEYNV